MLKVTTDFVSESPVVSPWLGGVGDPCGWGFWHLWLQLAQVFYLSFQKQACHTRVDPNQKCFVCRNRCPKGYSCAQDVPNDGPHHQIPVLLLLRIPKGLFVSFFHVLCDSPSGNKHHKTNKLAGISAVCRYTATEIPRPFHPWR